MARYGDQGRRSGYAVWRGGDQSLRLYDKPLEIRRNDKTHAMCAWHLAGWDGEQTVWRTEIQLRRNVLREFGVQRVPELLTSSAAKRIERTWAVVDSDSTISLRQE